MSDDAPKVKLVSIESHDYELVQTMEGWRASRIERIPVWKPTALGDALRETRVRFGLSMGDCGRALSISTEQYSGLENGRSTLSAEDWCKVWTTLHAVASVSTRGIGKVVL